MANRRVSQESVYIWGDWKVSHDSSRPKQARWEATHKDYDGPEDGRHYWGPTWPDVREQILENNS